jgi:hypothetical protein
LGEHISRQRTSADFHPDGRSLPERAAVDGVIEVSYSLKKLAASSILGNPLLQGDNSVPR